MANNPQKDPSEDWMTVLDNFLDNDEQGNRAQQQQQQFQQSHPKSSSSHPNAGVGEQNAATSSVMSSNLEVQSTNTSVAPSTNSSLHDMGCGDVLDNPDLSEEKKAQIRSERKRNREKQRRSDVNSQFSSLTELLKRVEGYDLDSDVSDDEEETETKKRKVGTVGSVMNITPSNRVDLIARTIAVMDRLHQVNRSLRQNVKNLRSSLNKAKLGNEKSMNSMNQQAGMNPMMGMAGMGNPAFGGGMMMMVPQQMGSNMCSQSSQQGQTDNKNGMMMMVPMMMPNNQMNSGQCNPQFMPNMNMMNPFMQGQQGMMQNQLQVQQQVSQQPQPQQQMQMAQGRNQQNMNNQQQQQQQQQQPMNQLSNNMDAVNNSPALSTMNSSVHSFNINEQGMNMPNISQQQQQQQLQQQADPQAGNMSMTVPMAVYNPITNAWNTPAAQVTQMQGGRAVQQQHPAVQQQQPSQSSMNDKNRRVEDNSGASSYGGNLAHCA